MVTLGAGLNLQPGCWQWTTEAETGGVGIFNAADEHNSLYTPGSLYAAVSLTEERLEAEAAKLDLVLDRNVLGGSGVHSRRLDESTRQGLARKFSSIHSGRADGTGAGVELLSALIEYLARLPINHHRRVSGNQHAKTVHRARTYIHEHLDEPKSLDAVVAAAFTYAPYLV